MHATMKAGLVALAALWAGAALAQSPAPGNHPSHMESLGILLDLTDAQKPQVQAILQAEHTQMRTLFEQAKAAGGKPDFQAMKAAHQQISQDTLTKLSGVLNATQLKKFQTLQQMHAHGFGRAGHGPPPPMSEAAPAPQP
jgi:hypothetical protein